MDIALRWRPGIGDPSFMGWFTVFAYVAASLACALTALRGRNAGERNTRNHRLLWGGVSILMLFLAVNKQLDLQSLFTDIGRVIAKSQGWYEQRRGFQFWLTLGIGACGALAFITLALMLRKSILQHWLLLFGIAFLLTFIVMRAASFHHFEDVLRFRIAYVKLNWAFELGGIGCILLSARSALNSKKNAVAQ